MVRLPPPGYGTPSQRPTTGCCRRNGQPACALALRSSRPSPLNQYSAESRRLRGQDRRFDRVEQIKTLSAILPSSDQSWCANPRRQQPSTKEPRAEAAHRNSSRRNRSYRAPSRSSMIASVQPGWGLSLVNDIAATTRFAAPAYWKFESISLQRGVCKLSVPRALPQSNAPLDAGGTDCRSGAVGPAEPR